MMARPDRRIPLLHILHAAITADRHGRLTPVAPLQVQHVQRIGSRRKRGVREPAVRRSVRVR